MKCCTSFLLVVSLLIQGCVNPQPVSIYPKPYVELSDEVRAAAIKEAVPLSDNRYREIIEGLPQNSRSYRFSATTPEAEREIHEYLKGQGYFHFDMPLKNVGYYSQNQLMTVSTTILDKFEISDLKAIGQNAYGAVAKISYADAMKGDLVFFTNMRGESGFMERFYFDVPAELSSSELSSKKLRVYFQLFNGNFIYNKNRINDDPAYFSRSGKIPEGFRACEKEARHATISSPVSVIGETCELDALVIGAILL